MRGPGIDIQAMSLAAFEDYAAWGSDEAWDRYSFAHVAPLVDRSGRMQALIDAKACVPAEHRAGFIAATLDHAINQTYRALKCRREGDELASRLEAAAGITPLLDMVFALHAGRLRPYAKYLRWELERWPLELSPMTSDALLADLEAVLARDGGGALRRLLLAFVPPLREAGHGPTIDAWGDVLD